MRIIFWFLIVFSPISIAEIYEMANGLKLDASSYKAKDCSNTPGEICIWHCYTAINFDTPNMFNCSFEATGFFKEKITTPSGDLYTGNRLIATDYRNIVVYPYQDVEICFNFGKETYRLPQHPDQIWVYTKARIVAECNGARDTMEF